MEVAQVSCLPQVLMLSGAIYLLLGPACAGPAKLGVVFLATGAAQRISTQSTRLYHAVCHCALLR